MLKKMEIRLQTDRASYQRGQYDYEGGRVRRMSVSWGVAGDAPNTASAIVLGSRDRSYSATVTVSPDDLIVGYDCSCPVAAGYCGMCEHCVAVALAYREEERRRAGMQDGRQGGMVRRSSSPMIRMLARYQMDSRPVSAGDAAGQVELEFTFQPGWYSDLILECRIGRSYKYVVKNIAKLVRDIEERRDVQYGARLSFVHDLSAFTPESRKRCQVLREVVPALIPHYRDAAESTGQQYRTLWIEEPLTDRFLDLSLGGTVRLQETDLPVMDSNPQVFVRIRGARGGLTIDGSDVRIFHGARSTYILTDDGFHRCTPEFAKNMLPFLEALQREQLFLSRSDYEGFCAYILPAIEPYCEIDSGGIDLDSFTPPEPEFTVCFAMPSGSVIAAAAGVRYGSRCYDLLGKGDSGEKAGTWRDFGKEEELTERIRRYFPHSSPNRDDSGASCSGAGRKTGRRGRPRKRPELVGGVPVRDLDSDEEPAAPVRRRLRGGREVDEYGLPVRDLDEDIRNEAVRTPSLTTVPKNLSGRGNLSGMSGLPAEKDVSAVQGTPDGAVRGLLRHYDPSAVPDGDEPAVPESVEDTDSGMMMPADLTAVYAVGEDEIYRFLDTGISEIGDLSDLFVDDSVRRLRIRRAPKVTFGVSIRSNLLDFDVSAEDMDAEEIAGILGAYRERRKYYRLKNGDFLPVRDDDSLGTAAELMDGMMISEKDLASGHFTTPLYRALYAENVLRGERQAEIRRGEEYRRLIRGIRNASEEDAEVPADLHAHLRRYQREGFSWLTMLCRYGFGGILADDMGLGKTVQIITLLLSRGKPSLVVAPASLLYNWESEVRRFAPGLTVQIIAGAAAERKEKIRESSHFQVNITSYDLLKRDAEEYADRHFDCLVADEAQYIKNAGTQAARAVKMVAASHRFALTGTPVENRLSDLWSIFDYLMPGYFGSYSQFRSGIEIPVVQDRDEKAQARLQKMAAPFILRRRKEDVLKDLPAKLEENIFVPMTERQEELYRAEAAHFRQTLAKKSESEVERGQIEILAMITRLRQICCAPELCYENYRGGSGKIGTCLDLLESAVSGGHHVLVFSQFTSLLELIRAKWEKRSAAGSLYLSGKSSARQRQQMVKQFQAGEAPVFFISLKAGGTGLNLTAADIVIHCDPWWNAAAQNQATDRAHRIGQTKVVNVMKLVAKGTIEEKILALQEKKAALAASVTEGEGVQDYRLNREELMELFAG